MTAAIRFDGELNVDMNEFQTNLVPFPRLHFMTTSLAPVISKDKAGHEAHDTKRITDDCLQATSFLVKYPDFDVVEDKYMAISINYRGEIKSQESNSVIQWVKSEKISRPQCVKALWAYIKENNLQDPENKRFFTPDKKMAKVFGSTKMKCFHMTKFFKAHLTEV